MFENGFSLVDYKLEMSDSNYMVVFTFEDAEFNQITKTKIVYFYENGDSYLLAFYDVYMDEIDNMEVDLLLENFAMSAGDTTILTTSVCHLISGGSDGEDNDCDGIVNNVRENGYELLIGEKEDLGNNYIIELVYMNANNNYSEFYYFSFYYDADMVLKASMNLLDTKSFIYNDIYTLFGEMNDFTIPTDEVCATNIHEDSVARCISIRTFHESNGYIILISELTLDDEMNVVVHTVTYDSTGIEIEKNTFVMNYMRDANGNNPIGLVVFEAKKDKTVKFLQIWLFPNQRNVEPRYDQKRLNDLMKENEFVQILEGIQKMFNISNVYLLHITPPKSVKGVVT